MDIFKIGGRIIDSMSLDELHQLRKIHKEGGDILGNLHLDKMKVLDKLTPEEQLGVSDHLKKIGKQQIDIRELKIDLGEIPYEERTTFSLEEIRDSINSYEHFLKTRGDSAGFQDVANAIEQKLLDFKAKLKDYRGNLKEIK